MIGKEIMFSLKSCLLTVFPYYGKNLRYFFIFFFHQVFFFFSVTFFP